MYAQQIYEIKMGLYEDMDVSIYANSQYNWMQMKEIRLGLEKRLDVSLYTNYLFSHWQMKGKSSLLSSCPERDRRPEHFWRSPPCK